MEITKTTIEDFLSSLPDDSQEIMRRLDQEISKALPKVDKVMWEGKFWGGSEQRIIGYGQWTYRGSTNKEVSWFVVGLAAQKNYITVFINGIEDGQYIAEKYKKELGKVKVGKSSISFRHLEDIELDNLIKLVKKSFELMPQKR